MPPPGQPKPDLITELLAAEQNASPADYRQEAIRLRREAQKPENAPIRKELVRVARQFDDLATSIQKRQSN
jgi:hypothetical protein